jgi:NTP pyrophosphatase (non-canonical NTP hydrolase)
MIDLIKKSQVLTFRGRHYLVQDIDNESDLIWLMEKPEKPGVCATVFGKSMILREADLVIDVDFIPRRTKTEIDARIDELRRLESEKPVDLSKVKDFCGGVEDWLHAVVSARISSLEQERSRAVDDIFSSIVESHKVLCQIKQMGEKEAYGQDPAFYYSAGVAGEAGELLNKMVKALRKGGDATDGLRAAVLSELPDVVIYAFVLAYVLDIDLTRLVTEKAHVVVERAMSGYYGGPLFREANRSCSVYEKSLDSPRCFGRCGKSH